MSSKEGSNIGDEASQSRCSAEEFELFLQDLHAALPILNRSLAELRSKNTTSAQVEILLKAIHELGSGAAIIQIDSIAQLMYQWEDYFHFYKMHLHPLDENILNLFYKTISLLKSVTESPNFNTSLITEFLACSKDVEVLLQQQASDKGRKISNQSGGAHRFLDADTVRKLRMEILHDISICQQALQILAADPRNRDGKEKLILASERLGEKIRKTGIPLMIKFTNASETAFKNIQQSKQEISTEQIEHFIKGLNLLKSLFELPHDSWDNWTINWEPEINSWIQSLKGTPSQAPVNPYQGKKVSSALESKKDNTLFDLFRIELEMQTNILNEGLLALEGQPQGRVILQSLMRAAHSIKGAARVIQQDLVVQLAHALEDCFSAALDDKLMIEDVLVELFLHTVDFLSSLYHLDEADFEARIKENKPIILEMVASLKEYAGGRIPEATAAPRFEGAAASVKGSSSVPLNADVPASSSSTSSDRYLRVTAQNLNQLMGLAGESLVESLVLQPFGEGLLKLKREQNNLSKLIDILRDDLNKKGIDDITLDYLTQLQHKANECRQQFSERLSEFDIFFRSHESLAERLYGSVIDIRMRPFADGVKAFPRMVRDLAKDLGKKVRFEIVGLSTPVDRDILEKLEAPLTHLLRNAVDHGIGTPLERELQGKSPEGLIKLEAHHRAGMLAISVSDDGRGIDYPKLRNIIQERNLASPEIAQNLSESELIDFLFLPGFSTAKQVTEISGRGVGLNIVQNLMQEVGGVVKTVTEKNVGTTFYLQLPLTLSVIRSLLVQIAGEPFAFPLSRIDHALYVPENAIEMIEGRQYFRYEGINVGLVQAYQILGMPQKGNAGEELPVVLLSDRLSSYGVIVDKFLGGKELVVQELDPNLGKIPNVSAGSFMEDGMPLLIIDIEDMIRSIDKALSEGSLSKVGTFIEAEQTKKAKKILVVDDSITVREVECRLLENKGYIVDTAVNGMDGWNAIRTNAYDLVITDVDMPRMNGIELVKAIKSNPRLQNMPVLIVSYKDREEDRKLGLEAGANYYLTKSSFHDETLLNAVIDLIGEPAVEEVL